MGNIFGANAPDVPSNNLSVTPQAPASALSWLKDEYFGQFTYMGIKFRCGYRFGGASCGGYNKCLVIYSGYDGKERYIGHSYFGDDKFEIKSVTYVKRQSESEVLAGDILELELAYPISKQSPMFMFDKADRLQNITFIAHSA